MHPNPAAPALATRRLLVVGDVMLDRYWFGEVERISPEAPVPVVRVRTTEERLGGAANVARNVVSVGARAGLLSVVGADEAGGGVGGGVGAPRPFPPPPTHPPPSPPPQAAPGGPRPPRGGGA